MTHPVRAIPVAALDRDRDATPSGPGHGRSSLLPAIHCEHKRHCRCIWGIERGPFESCARFTTTWLCSFVTAPAQPERRQVRNRLDAISAAVRSVRRMPEAVGREILEAVSDRVPRRWSAPRRSPYPPLRVHAEVRGSLMSESLPKCDDLCGHQVDKSPALDRRTGPGRSRLRPSCAGLAIGRGRRSSTETFELGQASSTLLYVMFRWRLSFLGRKTAECCAVLVVSLPLWRSADRWRSNRGKSGDATRFRRNILYSEADD